MPVVTAGLDEVGIGALCGPYIAAVAVFREKDLALLPHGVRDSKKTSDIQRGMLFLPICRAAFDIGIGHAWPWEIDSLGHSRALQLTYERALRDLVVQFDVLYVDGNIGVKDFLKRQVIEPKADARYREVSAASIVAKWVRDEMMIHYGKLYPVYRWEENKGYGTKSHEDAIRTYGLIMRDNQNRKTEYLHRRLHCRKFLYEGGFNGGGGIRAVGNDSVPDLQHSRIHPTRRMG